MRRTAGPGYSAGFSAWHIPAHYGGITTVTNRSLYLGTDPGYVGGCTACHFFLASLGYSREWLGTLLQNGLDFFFGDPFLRPREI